MTPIDIDFDVYKQLTLLRNSETDTYNDVVRRLLKLPSKSPESSESSQDWVSKGYRFPEGTEFRAEFNGSEYFASIKDGKLTFNGKIFGSFSGAAKEVTGGQRNGWDFWEQRQPGGRWRKLY